MSKNAKKMYIAPILKKSQKKEKNIVLMLEKGQEDG
jgi:hypothetical protein